jgi:hypothetical protein
MIFLKEYPERARFIFKKVSQLGKSLLVKGNGIETSIRGREGEGKDQKSSSFGGHE